MARLAFTDHLLVHSFWAMDVSFIGAKGAPIMSPMAGFSKITLPEVTVKTKEIQEGNNPFSKKVVQGGSIGNLTLERGIVYNDSDFWRWTKRALSGNLQYSSSISSTYVRNILVIHFFSQFPFGSVLGAQDAMSGFDRNTAVNALGLGGITSIITNIRIPAKGYVFMNCIPTNCKIASDFDANTSAVSVSTLTLACDDMMLVDLSGANVNNIADTLVGGAATSGTGGFL